MGPLEVGIIGLAVDRRQERGGCGGLTSRLRAAIVSMGYRSQVTLDNRLYYALMYIECDTFDLP